MKTEQALGITGGILSSIIAAACGSWQIILVVFLAYAIALFGNLGTGLMYAHQTGTYSSSKARHATYQKGGMLLGIGVLAFFDLLLMGAARSLLGFEYFVPILATMLAGYSAVHELSSMVENIKRLGNRVPAKLEETLAGAEADLDQGKIPDLKKIVTGSGGTAGEGGDPT